MKDKPMTVGEWQNYLNEFHPDEPIGLYGHPPDTTLRLIWDEQDDESSTKRLVIFAQ